LAKADTDYLPKVSPLCELIFGKLSIFVYHSKTVANNKKHRLIFELSKSERESRLMSVLNEAIKVAADMQQPLVYKNNLCIQPNFFIHQYPNGKKFLIEQNQENSQERILKELY
jgi:hypothetical protein